MDLFAAVGVDEIIFNPRRAMRARSTASPRSSSEWTMTRYAPGESARAFWMPCSAGEARLADRGEECAVREVDPAVFDGEAVV